MHKKAMEMSIQTIIIAILAIVVLFVLIGIFTGQITWFGGEYKKVGQSVFECKPEGMCRERKSGCFPDESHAYLKRGCPANEICCIKSVLKEK